MNFLPIGKKILFYLPRALSLVIVGGLALFIGEGFDPNFTWFDSFMHLIFALVVLGITALSWKKPGIGGWIFIVIGIFYIVSVIQAQWFGGLFIGSIPAITGLSFVLGKDLKKP